MATQIPLHGPNGQVVAFATVDDEDAESLRRIVWRVTFTPQGKMYACAFVKLHRYIVGATDPETFVDHANGDALDNRRSNLRPCTRAENVRNSRTRRDNTSGVKGVGWDKRTNKWQARITVDGKVHSLGRFDTIEEARDSYAAAAKRLHGEFHNLG